MADLYAKVYNTSVLCTYDIVLFVYDVTYFCCSIVWFFFGNDIIVHNILSNFRCWFFFYAVIINTEKISVRISEGYVKKIWAMIEKYFCNTIIKRYVSNNTKNSFILLYKGNNLNRIIRITVRVHYRKFTIQEKRTLKWINLLNFISVIFQRKLRKLLFQIKFIFTFQHIFIPNRLNKDIHAKLSFQNRTRTNFI